MDRIKRLLIITFTNLRTIIFLKTYKVLNFRKEKIFVYTDSRGFQIANIYNRKSPFNSYISYLVKNYNCDVFICPEKHTTIFDFLYQLKLSGGADKYEKVISHIGVVDFSPRAENEVIPILELKKHKIIDVFGTDTYNMLTEVDVYKEEYMGQQTASIASYNMINSIAEKFNAIANFIWISCNPIDVQWRGNYMRDRPVNINIVNDKSKELMPLLDDKVTIIDLTNWSNEEVHQYTCDNIHMSEEGMQLIKNKISEVL